MACATLHAQPIYKSVDAEGHVVYSNEPDPSAPQTSIALPDAPSPPDLIHFCWTNCFTLQMDNGVYRRTDGSTETWTVERFTPESAILHRHSDPAAWNGNKTDVAYAGRVVDGWLTNVTVNGRPVPEVSMTWGAALESLPGSNAEREQRRRAPLQPPVFAPSVQTPAALEPGSGQITSNVAPPPLLEDVQPAADVDGYIWTPGYWAWGVARYYWVPGAWARPPRFGVLWTPGYWAYAGGFYTFNPGYWGPHVGYYGGINYGYGYFGTGYAGGRWVGNSFSYNRSVNNLNATVIRNVYSEAAAAPANTGRVSYNGGPGGTTASPSAQERAAAAEPHAAPTAQQRQIAQRAAGPVPASAGNHAVRSGNSAAPTATATPPSAVAKPNAAQRPTARPVENRSPAPPEAAPAPVTSAEPVGAKPVAGHAAVKPSHP